MVKLVCIVEFAGHGITDEDSAQRALDRFRESVLPEQNYGITIYRTTPIEVLETFPLGQNWDSNVAKGDA